MLLKMVGQGLLAGAIVAALAYSYQIYREVGIDGSFVAAQDGDE